VVFIGNVLNTYMQTMLIEGLSWILHDSCFAGAMLNSSCTLVN